MIISIVIPTHKQQFLKDTLLSLRNQKGISTYDYEVLVVENPVLTEETANLVNEMGTNFIPTSSELGSNNARNTGIEQAQSDIIAITDDDCVLENDWVSKCVGLNAIYIDTIIGGPLHIQHRETPPEWLKYNLETEFDVDEFPVNIYGKYLVSANMTFSKKLWENVGGFNGEIGYHGKDELISNDEIQFVNKCSKDNKKVIYYSKLKAYHQIPAEKHTIEYLKKKAYGQGYADARMWTEDNPDLKCEDLYNKYAQNIFYNPTIEDIVGFRGHFCDEPTTRQFIRVNLILKTEYMKGVVDFLQ